MAGKPPNKQRTQWQIFLDSLSILCDHENGGKTVAAIAVESGFSKGDNATFWIVVNHEKPKKSTSVRERDHLIGILQKLQQGTQNEKAVEELMLHVFDAATFKAKDRVNNYRKKLQSVIANLQQRSEELSLEEGTLLQAIERLIDENRTVGSLCKKAYDFRFSVHARTLVRKAQHAETELWKYVCHFIGRLGSWFKAARFLFQNAGDYTEVLRDCKVDIVPCNEEAKTDPPPPMWELESLLSQTLPRNLAVSKERWEHLFGPGAFAAATARLKKCQQTGWRLKAHAEASMARFFLLGNRRFINDDRYIGCSKPSCKCCELYLQCLPGHFERRPCHGNTWTQWLLPGLRPSACPEEMALMQRMADRLQREVEVEITLASKGHVFTHDSSTDMSSVFARLSLR